MTPTLSQIAQNGTLRAAINLGNRALAWQDDSGALQGVTPALATRLADQLGLRLSPVIYHGAGKVFDAALDDQWDVAFLAIDPKRQQRLSFTRPYHTIEATYAVRADAPFVAADTVDLDGVRILSAQGSAYALHLEKVLQTATLEQLGTPDESFAAFKEGSWDMVAGVRASLERQFGSSSEYRILPGALARVEQAMVLPGPSNDLIGLLDAFVAQSIDEGFVAAALGG